LLLNAVRGREIESMAEKVIPVDRKALDVIENFRMIHPRPTQRTLHPLALENPENAVPAKDATCGFDFCGQADGQARSGFLKGDEITAACEHADLELFLDEFACFVFSGENVVVTDRVMDQDSVIGIDPDDTD
jgi:hypothetical protein